MTFFLLTPLIWQSSKLVWQMRKKNNFDYTNNFQLVSLSFNTDTLRVVSVLKSFLITLL